MKQRKCTDMPDELWPPVNAIEKEVVAYRLTNDNCVKSDDFIPLYEIHKAKGNIVRENLSNDMYYALSVFEELEDAQKLLRLQPWRFKRISTGLTKCDDGCIRATPNKNSASHTSWWLYEDAIPERYFKLVEEDVNE